MIPLAAASLLALGVPEAGTVAVLYDGAHHDTRATGFFVAPDLVVTALHAVTGNEPADLPRRVTIADARGRRFPVELLAAWDLGGDACAVRLPVESRTWLRPAREVVVGAPITVLPNPLRRRERSLETHIVHTRYDETGGLRYRVADPLRRRSGAPAVDREGRLVGFVSTTYELVPAATVARMLQRPRRVALREAHTSFARSPHGLLDFAVAAYRHGERTAALSYVQAAVAGDPQLASAHNLLGVLLRQEGRYEEARKHYERALGLLPDYAPARHNLGLLTGELGRRGRAAAVAAADVAGPNGIAVLEQPESRPEDAPAPTVIVAEFDPNRRRLEGLATLLLAFGLPVLLLYGLHRLRLFRIMRTARTPETPSTAGAATATGPAAPARAVPDAG
ncbi:MAG: trypsin-like peptidase domain-containing protein [Deltaproteobacteria bacterium]|nr:trypsin-like peptidase domain-containing protein [Deltaproteobacteria bacterium]